MIHKYLSLSESTLKKIKPKFTASFLWMRIFFRNFLDNLLKMSDYGIESRITSKTTSKIITAANSVNEIAAGSDC